MKFINYTKLALGYVIVSNGGRDILDLYDTYGKLDVIIYEMEGCK